MLGNLTNEEIESLLHAQVIGRIGCHAAGRTYVVPITYAYDGTCAYAHSGDGLKIRMMREAPEVCFKVERVDDLARWSSVIAWGRFEELHGAEAGQGLAILVERLKPLMVSATARPTHGDHQADTAGHVPVIYRIRLGERTGRFDRR